MIASTMNDRDLKLTPPPDLNAEQRKVWDAYYEPRNESFRKLHLQGQRSGPLEISALSARLLRD